MNTMYKTVYVEPMGKPRMTQRDKWMKRPCVMRYRAMADVLKREFQDDDLDDAICLSFECFISMPKSWSKKKKTKMSGQLHRQKPDLDNITKGLYDAILQEDCKVAMGCFKKMWDDGKGARFEIYWV